MQFAFYRADSWTSQEKREILEPAACKRFPPTPRPRLHVAVADPDARTRETPGERPDGPGGCRPVGPLMGFLGGFVHPNAFFPGLLSPAELVHVLFQPPWRKGWRPCRGESQPPAAAPGAPLQHSRAQPEDARERQRPAAHNVTNSAD